MFIFLGVIFVEQAWLGLGGSTRSCWNCVFHFFIYIFNQSDELGSIPLAVAASISFMHGALIYQFLPSQWALLGLLAVFSNQLRLVSSSVFKVGWVLLEMMQWLNRYQELL